MDASPLINRLIEDLRRLPGVGPKTARRMALHLLQHDRDAARNLAASLVEAAERVGHCRICRSLSEAEICAICANAKRDRSLLCVVESPVDVRAIESGTDYRGLYFVLLGRLSPLDGIGPEQIGIQELQQRLQSGEVKEVIIATNPTVEGEATAHFIAELVQGLGIDVSRIAHGVPLGGELEYVDGGTLSHAFNGRKKLGNL